MNIITKKCRALLVLTAAVCWVGGGAKNYPAGRRHSLYYRQEQAPAAVKVTELRLQRQPNLFSPAFTVQLHKYDEDVLLNDDPFKFEAWIIQEFGGAAQALSFIRGISSTTRGAASRRLL